MQKVKRVAHYARVSHDEQAKFGYSVQNQIERLANHSKEQNHIVVDVFIDDGYSAGTAQRPAYQEMLSRLNEFDEIIFTRLDRFSRNVLDANEVVLKCDKAGVGIKAIDEDIDTTTADGMFDFNLKVSLAQRELAKGSERICTVFGYMVKQGKPITGSVPFGYIIETLPNGSKRIIKDPDTEHIVNEIIDHFMTYQSVRGTANHINAKYNVNFAYNRYRGVIRKEEYTGLYRGNPNYFPAYVTKEQFQRIQEIADNNIRVKKGTHTHIFAGLAHCPKCGKKLVSQYFSRKGRNGVKKEYRYYRCGTYFVHNEKCGTRFAEEKIEKLLLQDIKSQAEKYIYKATAEPTEPTDNSKEIKEILSEMDSLNYMFRKKRISQKDYDRDYEELEKRLAKLEREKPKEKDISGIEAFLNSGWENVYENLSREDKRALIRSVVKSIRFAKNDDIMIEFV